MEQFVIVDRTVRSWQELCDRLSRAAGINCRMGGGRGAYGSPFEARGSVGDVLESARLLGRLNWRVTPGRGAQAPGLEILPGPADH